MTIDQAAEERRRIQRWMQTATKPPTWRGRDSGSILRAVDLEMRAELVTVRAWIEAVLAAVEAPAWSIAHWATDEYWAARRRLVLAQAEGRVSLSADQLPPDMDPDVRQALLGPDVAEEVLGYAERGTGQWVLGLAGLTPPEADAFRYLLEPNEQGMVRSAQEVRDMMDRRRGRKGMPLAIETVEGHLSRARSKLRRLASTMVA